jgi:hypothetical protein
MTGKWDLLLNAGSKWGTYQGVNIKIITKKIMMRWGG